MPLGAPSGGVGVPVPFRRRSWCFSGLTVSSFLGSSWRRRKKRHRVERRGKSEREEERRQAEEGARERHSGQRDRPVTRARSRKSIAGAFGVPWLAFALGDLPVTRARSLLLLSLAFCRLAPLAARRERQPCKEGESRRLRTRGGNGALWTPSPPCKQGRAVSPLPSCGPGGFLPAGGLASVTPWSRGVSRQLPLGHP